MVIRFGIAMIKTCTPRAIRLWNEILINIKDAPTVPAFASGLNNFNAF